MTLKDERFELLLKNISNSLKNDFEDYKQFSF